jgi:hypothetical protein
MGSPSLSIQKDPGSAIKLFLEAADAGYPIANVVVGLKFEAGVGVPQDINRAMLEFERVSDGRAAAAAAAAVVVVVKRCLRALCSRRARCGSTAAKNSSVRTRRARAHQAPRITAKDCALSWASACLKIAAPPSR